VKVLRRHERLLWVLFAAIVVFLTLQKFIAQLAG